MRKAHVARDGTQVAGRRKHRPRPTPKWLQTEELDAIARSRCLMVLSVLSGETPVTDAIREAKISRGTYYQMETRALEAMLAALNPLASSSASGAPDLSAAAARISQLEAQVKALEQDRRRTQRLLLLTRKSIRAPVTMGRRGWPPKKVRQGLSLSGRPRWRALKAKATPAPGSTPTRAGESAP